jgi:hypothetical protein
MNVLRLPPRFSWPEDKHLVRSHVDRQVKAGGIECFICGKLLITSRDSRSWWPVAVTACSGYRRALCVAGDVEAQEPA